MPTQQEIQKSVGSNFIATISNEKLIIRDKRTNCYVDIPFNEPKLEIEKYKRLCLRPAIAALNDKFKEMNK